MKLFLQLCFAFTLVLNMAAQAPQFYNTKKMAQVTGLPGGDLSNIWGYTAPDGKEYAIVGSKTATNIYDVSNCGNPILKTSIPDGLNTSWREYKVYKNFLYSVSELSGGNGANGGLKMYDLTDINNITYTNATQVDSFITNGHTLSIDTATSRLYISGASAAHMLIYQLSPTSIRPKLIKKIPSLTTGPVTNGYIHDLYVNNDTIYASHLYSNAFAVYRLRTSPDTAVIRLGYNNEVNGYNHSSWPHPFHPQYFYCATETHGVPMTIYEVQNDINNSVNVLKRKQFKDPLGAPTFTNNIYHNPHAKGNELYISAYHDGVVIYDISEPLLPVKVAHYDSYPQAPIGNTTGYSGYQGAWGVFPYFASGCHLISDIHTGFHTFKTDFRKVTFDGTLHLSTSDAGIVFLDSLNQKIKIKVDNAGSILYQPISSSISVSDLRVDSADVEILNNHNLILTAPNGSKYNIFIDNSGNLTSQYIAVVPSTNITSHAGNVWINSNDKGLVIKSSDNQRWKLIAKTANTISTRKTAF